MVLKICNLSLLSSFWQKFQVHCLAVIYLVQIVNLLQKSSNCAVASLKNMGNGISTTKYNEMLHEIIAEVKMTRVVVANRLSATVTQLYWNIGKRLSTEKLEKGYGGKVVEQLSVDLKSEFPDTEGFSPRSLWDMKRLYEFYTETDQILPQPVAESENNILPQVVAVLPWGHNRLILSKIKNK